MSEITTQKKPVGVYVHFPFCERKCPYCDFYSEAIRHIPQKEYTNALLKESYNRVELLGEEFQLVSIYIGGGTPSLWNVDLLSNFIYELKSSLPACENLELTVEMNPNSVSDKFVQKLIEAGVNRFSLGVQSLNDEALKFLGRIHDSKQALDTLAMLRDFDVRFGVDLLFGWHFDSIDRFLSDLDLVLHYNPVHLSVYELTAYEQTPFGRSVAAGRELLLNEDSMLNLMLSVWDAIEDAGFLHYEVSNFAQAGFESVHNRLYWTGATYIGLGASAHGFIYQSPQSATRYANKASFVDYIDEVSTNGFAHSFVEHLNSTALLEERMMLGLRMFDGFSISEVEKFAGVPNGYLLNRCSKLIDTLNRLGLIDFDDDHIRPTRDGILLANSLALQFFDCIS